MGGDLMSEPEVPLRVDQPGTQEDGHGDLPDLKDGQEVVVADMPVVERQDQALGRQVVVARLALAYEGLEIEQMVPRGENVQGLRGGFPGDIVKQQDGDSAPLHEFPEKERQTGESQDFEQKGFHRVV